MPVVLTTKIVDKAISERRIYDTADARVPGLTLRSGLTGAKWIVRPAGKKIPLGSASDLPLAEARKLAQEVIARVKSGFVVDESWILRQKVALGIVEDGALAPVRPVVKPLTWTWEQAVEKFLFEVARTRKPGTHKNYKEVLANPSVLGKFAGQVVAEITREDVARLVDDIHGSGRETMAASVVSILRPMWKFLSRDARKAESGVKEHILFGLEKPEKSRGYGRKTRVPTLEACGRIVAACRLGVFEPTIALALELLVLTAQRRLTIATVRREHVVVDPLRMWQIPGEGMKGNHEHFLPITPRMAEIFRAAKGAGSGDWMFPQVRARRKGMGLTHVNESTLSHNMSDFGADASPHDIRRAFTTVLCQHEGYDEPDAALILDHREGRKTVTANHYNRHQYIEEKRTILGIWAAALEPYVKKAMDEMDVTAEKARLAEKRQAKAKYKTGKRPKVPNVGKRLRAKAAAQDAAKQAVVDANAAQAVDMREILEKVLDRTMSDAEAMTALRIDNPLSLLVTLSDAGYDAHARADLATEAAGAVLKERGLRSPFGSQTPEARAAAEELLHAFVDIAKDRKRA